MWVAVTIVGTLGAVGGAALAVARGSGVWSPSALPGEAPARRVRRLVAVTRSGGGRGNGRDAAGVEDPDAVPTPTRRAAGAAGAAGDGTAGAEDDDVGRGRTGGATPASRSAGGADAAFPTGASSANPAELVAEVAPPPVPVEPTVRSEVTRLADRVELQGADLVGRLDGLARDVAAARAEERARQAAVDARQEAALERLRAELAAGMAARAGEASEREERLARLRFGERRAEAAAELYARLARLEAAVAAVTNPILLPGEPYAPPPEFLADALAWENWKDVGERAFAFADQVNTQRLLLGTPVRDELAAFVTELRGVLTRSVYPNLRPDATPEQLAALRAALDRIAEEVPRVRESLAREYRAFAEGPPAAG